MKTIDSLIDVFENAVGEHGVGSVTPHRIVEIWESQTNSKVASDAIIELLRVWLEYRFAANLPVTPREAAALFPHIQFADTELESLEFEYRRLSTGSSNTGIVEKPNLRSIAELPDIGETWHGFLLLEVLGEGAFARVYLARQLSMAGRLVALKLTFRVTLESQLLSRLHHSAIVPIYSLHHQDGIHGLCMPYLGNTTLMDLLKEILPANANSFRSTDSADGVELLDILVHRESKLTTVANYSTVHDTDVTQKSLAQLTDDEVEGSEVRRSLADTRLENTRSSSTLDTSEAGQRNRITTAKELSKLDYVGAVTWIGAQLADALDHAHRQGVLHCDIKPANVLLAPDGQARLLDFNVSLEQRKGNAETKVGGTMAYMAPEHLAAVQGMGNSQIDARSDIYSLGIVLFEMLAGKVPKLHADDEDIPVRRLLHDANRAVTPALAAIIQKCVANRPEQRYATAGQLYDDLNAQCNRLPLVHQPEPSFAERIHKWIRRHPMLTSLSSISLFSGALITLSLVGFLWRGRQLERLDRLSRSESVQRLLPETISLVSATRNYPELTLQAQAQTADIIELLQDKSDLSFDLSIAPDFRQLQALVRLIKLNGLVAVDGELSNVDSLRTKLEEFTARFDEAQTSNPQRLAEFTNNTKEDHLLNAYLEGRFAEVIEIGSTLTQTNDFATWMFLGQSNLKMRDWSAARECFSICIALRPNIEITWFYRGIARLESKQHHAAIEDFRKAIALRSTFPSARYNMALAFDAVGEMQEALSQLDQAIADGWESVSGFAFRSKLHERVGNQLLAAQDLANALAAEPETELDWVRRGSLRLNSDSDGAKEDFEQALEINPSSIAGHQNLAHVLAEKLSQPEASLVHLNALVELEAQNPVRWSGRGVVLARLGRLAEAFRDLSHASTLKISDPLITYQIACGYSLVASQMDDATLEMKNSLPAKKRIKEAAIKWYEYSIHSQPSIAQIATTDPDIEWLKNQPEFK